MSVTKTLHTGETITWTALGVCFCSKCREVFNSAAAFDHHLKRPKGKQDGESPAEHDTTGMPRNSRGYLVTKLKPSRAVQAVSQS